MYTTFVNISYIDSIRNHYKKAYENLFDTYDIETINSRIDQDGEDKNLDTYLRQIYKKLHKTILFSKDRHTRVGSLTLENENQDTLTRDYEQVIQYYRDILIYKKH